VGGGKYPGKVCDIGFETHDVCLALLQCFDPYLGHRQAYITNLESVVHISVFSVFHTKRDPVWFTVLIIACNSGNEKMADKNVVTNSISNMSCLPYILLVTTFLSAILSLPRLHAMINTVNHTGSRLA
jgi:hypothetical protein